MRVEMKDAKSTVPLRDIPKGWPFELRDVLPEFTGIYIRCKSSTDASCFCVRLTDGESSWLDAGTPAIPRPDLYVASDGGERA